MSEDSNDKLKVSIKILAEEVGPEREWDFSDVPDEELECCFYYELACECNVLAGVYYDYVREHRKMDPIQIAMKFRDEGISPVRLGGTVVTLLGFFAKEFPHVTWSECDQSLRRCACKYLERKSVEMEVIGVEPLKNINGWVLCPC